MNKRGILMTYVLIFTILSISLAIGIFYRVESQKHTFEIGEVPSKVVKSYILVHEEEYFLENQMKVKSRERVSKLLENAGLKNPVKNGDYVLWKKDKECFPNDWDSLKSLLIEDLGYDVSRGSNSLIVKANIPLSQSFKGEGYSLNYSKTFDKEYIIEGFNFDDFVSKADKLKQVVDECSNLESCWDSNLDGFSYKKEGNLFKVSFTTQGLEGKLVIKVGIDFEEELNIGEEELRC